MKFFWSVIMVMMGFIFNLPGGLAAEVIKLPPPAWQSRASLAEALKDRRSVRRFLSRSLDLPQVSQLLWAADGVNDLRGHRTAPSAGATYPLELYLVVGEGGVAALAAGVYRYRVAEHVLEPVATGELRPAVARASRHQTWMAEAPVMLVIAAEYHRCTARYGERGIMYTHVEAGNVSQNLFLAAQALGLGAGIVGAFEDQAVAQVLQLPPAHEPLLVMPVGYK
jgi:SagB-type dehydrogenase family enzyme